MFEILLSIWASAVLTIYWSDFMRGPYKIPMLNFKPLNCETCLPVWLFAAFYVVSIYSCNIVAVIAGAFTAAILTYLALKLIRK